MAHKFANIAAAPQTETCPYCGDISQIPTYVFAHWADSFTVTCNNEKCRKKYYMYQGRTSQIADHKKHREKE